MMNRVEKKCVIASTAFHALLLGILLFGSALMPSPEESTFKPITVYSAASVSDALSSGGGSPDVKVAPPVAPPQQDVQPPTAKPIVEPPPVAKPPPEPPKQQVRDVPKPRIEIPKDEKIPKPEKIKTSKVKPPEHKVDFTEVPKSHHQIVLDKDSSKVAQRKADEKAKADREAAETAANNARREKAREFASAYRNISSKLSSATIVDTQSTPGPGGPGEVSVNYRDLIASTYYNAWSASADLDDNTPVVIARVTIARSGNVISARIIQPSGNAAMDRSIANVLQTVTFIEPFPAGAHESERTVTIKFNLLAKRGTG